MTKVVIVGSGGFAKKHASVLSSLGVDSVFVTGNSERYEQLSDEGYIVYDSIDGAVNGGDATHIIVASRPSVHVSDSEQAIPHGLPILLEKPVCTVEDLAGAKELIKSGELFQVGCVLRFDPGLLKFKSLLNSLGKIHYASACCQSYLPDWRKNQDYKSGYASSGKDGGVLTDLVHELDYMAWMFGEVVRVVASVPERRILGLPGEEQADLICETENSTFHVRLDYVTRKARRKVIAYGENGELSWDAIEGVVCMDLIGEEPQKWKFDHTALDTLMEQDRVFIEGAGHGDAATLSEGVNSISLAERALKFSEQLS